MSIYIDFIRELRKGLGEDLPGQEAHRQMMRHRKPLTEIPDRVKGAKLSAVLLLIYPKAERLHTVFIKRPAYEGVHSNQISFPGGKVEDSDRDLTHTALREAEEELGILEENLEVLGHLSPLYIPPSNFLVHPVLAFSETQPNYIPDPVEVADYIELPLHAFLDGENLKELSVVAGKNQKMRVNAYEMNGDIIWGATSMIMAELSFVLKKLNAPI